MEAGTLATIIDDIDAGNWGADEYEEDTTSSDPLSLDAKQAIILEKKQDLNVTFRSLLIEDGVMDIPLCRMISMQVVRPALANDILKLRGDFYSGYHPGAAVFYVSVEGIDGSTIDVGPDIISTWDSHWKTVNDEFEKYLESKPKLHHLRGKMFHVWDGNHRLQAWYPYINEVHGANLSRHVCVTSWVLNADIENRGSLRSIMDGVNV